MQAVWARVARLAVQFLIFLRAVAHRTEWQQIVDVLVLLSTACAAVWLAGAALRCVKQLLWILAVALPLLAFLWQSDWTHELLDLVFPVPQPASPMNGQRVNSDALPPLH
jgi:hypothetical protein